MSFAQRLTLFALEFDQTMQDVVLVQKIVELMSVTPAARSEHTQTGKLVIATQSPSSHDQRVHNWFANPWYFGQDPPEFVRGHVQDLRLGRCHSRSRQRGCALQHSHVADEIALVRDCEFQFDVVPPLEDLYFAAQNNSQTDIPLAGLIHYVSALHEMPLCKWFKQRKLMVV